MSVIARSNATEMVLCNKVAGGNFSTHTNSIFTLEKPSAYLLLAALYS